MSQCSPYRILMFAPFFPPRSGPESHVNGKLALAMFRRGWQLDVITLAPKEEHNESSEQIWEPLRDITCSVPRNYPGQMKLMIERAVGVLSTMHPISGIVWARHALKIARRLVREKEYDVILSRSLPAAGHLPAMILSRENKIPWLANWNDPAPPIVIFEPYGEGPTASIGFRWRHYMNSVTMSASWHTFPSDRLMNYMLRIYPFMRDKSSVIPHVALSDIVVTNPIKSNLFNLCHAGSLEIQRNPAIFFEGIKQFLKRNNKASDKILMKLVGNIASFSIPPELQKIIDIQGLHSYTRSLEIMSKANVILVIEAPMAEGIPLPSKFVDAVQCHCPIMAISPKIGVLSDFIKRYGGGIVADCKSPEEIALGLEILYRNWENMTLNSEFSTERLYQVFSEETVISLYKDLFRKFGVG